jgi:hypothetical protein
MKRSQLQFLANLLGARPNFQGSLDHKVAFLGNWLMQMDVFRSSMIHFHVYKAPEQVFKSTKLNHLFCRVCLSATV